MIYVTRCKLTKAIWFAFNYQCFKWFKYWFSYYRCIIATSCDFSTVIADKILHEKCMLILMRYGWTMDYGVVRIYSSIIQRMTIFKYLAVQCIIK